MTFASPMIITNDGLTHVADDATEPAIDVPLAEILKRASRGETSRGAAQST